MSPAPFTNSATTVAVKTPRTQADVPEWDPLLRKEIRRALLQAASPSALHTLVNDVCDEVDQEKQLADLVERTPQIQGYPTTMTPDMAAHLNEIGGLVEKNTDFFAGDNPCKPALVDLLMKLAIEGDNSLFKWVMETLQHGEEHLESHGFEEFRCALEQRIENTTHPFTEEVLDLLADVMCWAFCIMDLTDEPKILRKMAKLTPPEAHEALYEAFFNTSNYLTSECLNPSDDSLKILEDETIYTLPENCLILGFLEALLEDILSGGERAKYALVYVNKMDPRGYFPLKALVDMGVIDATNALGRSTKDDITKALVDLVRGHFAVLLEQQWLN
jgi:hypothetical protein